MRLIDADALMIATLNFCNGYKVKRTDRKVISWINHAPTIDAVPVTRCKDCKYYTERKTVAYNGHFCVRMTEFVQPDDFCSYGEKRDE